MRGVTPNLEDVVGIDEIGWLSGSRWVSPIVKEAHPYFPRVLVVDEDAAFSRRLAKIAIRNRIHLVTCSSARSLSQIGNQTPFDVAILDFASGELARKQVGRFVGDQVPILIVEESAVTNTLGKDFPKTIHKVLDKNVGARVILEEALALVGARHLLNNLESDGATEGVAMLTARHWYAFWLLAITIVLGSFAMVAHLSKARVIKVPNSGAVESFSRRHGSELKDPATTNIPTSPPPNIRFRSQPRPEPTYKGPKNIYRWDKAPVIPHVQVGFCIPCFCRQIDSA